jgi:hypothetical protein
MDHDQRLHAQKGKRNEEKTMKVDENVFFREALRESEERHRVTLPSASHSRLS